MCVFEVTEIKSFLEEWGLDSVGTRLDPAIALIVFPNSLKGSKSFNPTKSIFFDFAIAACMWMDGYLVECLDAWYNWPLLNLHKGEQNSWVSCQVSTLKHLERIWLFTTRFNCQDQHLVNSTILNFLKTEVLRKTTETLRRKGISCRQRRMEIQAFRDPAPHPSSIPSLTISSPDWSEKLERTIHHQHQTHYRTQHVYFTDARTGVINTSIFNRQQPTNISLNLSKSFTAISATQLNSTVDRHPVAVISRVPLCAVIVLRCKSLMARSDQKWGDVTMKWVTHPLHNHTHTQPPHTL
jgi:hypothetical protein